MLSLVGEIIVRASLHYVYVCMYNLNKRARTWNLLSCQFYPSSFFFFFKKKTAARPRRFQESKFSSVLKL